MNMNHLLLAGLALLGGSACAANTGSAPSAEFEVAPGHRSVRLDLKKVP